MTIARTGGDDRDDDDDRLDLGAWTAPPPPDDLTERILDAVGGRAGVARAVEPPAAAERPLRRDLIVGLAFAAAAAAAVVAIYESRPEPQIVLLTVPVHAPADPVGQPPVVVAPDLPAPASGGIEEPDPTPAPQPIGPRPRRPAPPPPSPPPDDTILLSNPIVSFDRNIGDPPVFTAPTPAERTSRRPATAPANLVYDASLAAMDGAWARALPLAERALTHATITPDDARRSHTIAALAACNLKRRDVARRHYAALPSGHRPLVRQRCLATAAFDLDA